MTASPFKVCLCCGTHAGPRKRRCGYCRVVAIFRAPTPAELAEREAKDRASRQLLREYSDDLRR